MYAATISGSGLAVGEQARIKGTSDTHAKADQPIGGWITVSIAAEAANGRQSRETFFKLVIFKQSNPFKPVSLFVLQQFRLFCRTVGIMLLNIYNMVWFIRFSVYGKQFFRLLLFQLNQAFI